MRRQERVQLILFLVWAGLFLLAIVTPLTDIGPRVSIGLAPLEKAFLACLVVNLLCLGAMYLADCAFGATDGLLSYTEWSRMSDKTPTATALVIGLCSFAAVVLITLLGSGLLAENAVDLDPYQRTLIIAVLACSFGALIALLLALNALDAVGAGLTTSATGQIRLRKTGWLSYLVSYHFFVHTLVLLCGLASPIAGVVFCALYWLLGFTFYFSLERFTYDFTTDPSLVAQYQQVRYEAFVGVYLGKDDVDGKSGRDEDDHDGRSEFLVVRNKHEVIGGARLTLHPRRSGELLPCEHDSWRISDFLGIDDLEERDYGEVSRLVIRSAFRKDRHLYELARQLYARAREERLRYLFVIAPQRLLEHYGVFGIRRASATPLPDRPGYAGFTMYLGVLDMSVLEDVQRMDAEFLYRQ